MDNAKSYEFDCSERKPVLFCLSTCSFYRFLTVVSYKKNEPINVVPEISASFACDINLGLRQLYAISSFPCHNTVKIES